MKNKQVIFWGLLITFAIGVSGCTSAVESDPVVVVTDIDYTSDPASVPYEETHSEFAEKYSGADLSIGLRDEIISIMRDKAEELGENAEVLYQCIKATYTNWSERPNRIPCYAEKCIYETESVWAIAFNRANSFDEETLGHFDLFFVSISNYEILYYTGCF